MPRTFILLRPNLGVLHKGQKEVVVLMLLTMDLEIQRNLAHFGAYDMLHELKAMFSKQAKQELLQTVREFHTCKVGRNSQLLAQCSKDEGHIDNLERLWYNQLCEEDSLPKKMLFLALHAMTSRVYGDSKKLKPVCFESVVGDGHWQALRPFTDDFSRYGYVYLLKHKHEVFETFKFLDHLKEHGIIAHRTPPYTPQNNGLCQKGEIEHDRHGSIHDDCQILYQSPLGIMPLEDCCSNLKHGSKLREVIKKIAETSVISDPYVVPQGTPSSKTRLVFIHLMLKEHKLGISLSYPSQCLIRGSKWLFKKKTDMDGAVYVFKARLVAKGFTQTYGVDYEETFSPVVDIRAIRILIAIAAYYDYEIMQMDCLIRTFLYGHLSKKSLWKQPEGFYAEYIAAFDASKEAVWIRKFIYGLGIVPTIEEPIRQKFWVRLPYSSNLQQAFDTRSEDAILDTHASSLFFSCYTDAGYLTDADNLKSQTGYVFVLNREAVWIRKFIFWLGIVPTIEEPISRYCDNTGAIAIAKDDGVTKGARHFRAKVHYLRETIKMGDVRIEKIDTDDNLADPFTKALAFPKHSELTRNIGLLPASSFM
ncbi:retrotransposon protein, putative, ty1-copia subclass [Tanacetum coccineum]